MSQVFWLREETKKNEFRRALTPDSCQELIAAGNKVVVEDWADSIIPIADYKAVGCEVVKAGSWVDSPKETIVVGLKALPGNIDTFIHRHIFFAHVYKEQDGWREWIGKFRTGGGAIIDLEYMVDDNGRRVCAFGYWAGFVGAALGALFSKAKNRDESVKLLTEKMCFPNKKELIKFVVKQTGNTRGESIVIGSSGRSGHGAIDCLNELNWNVMAWDKEETSRGGPFVEILSYNLLVNCVLTVKKIPIFIDLELLESNPRKLNMISDVSCDPDSDCNMIPLYSEATVLSHPIKKIETGGNWLGLTAIDNLPSILPKESSFDFSSQLTVHLLKFNESDGPVNKALKIYSDCLVKI